MLKNIHNKRKMLWIKNFDMVTYGEIMESHLRRMTGRMKIRNGRIQFFYVSDGNYEILCTYGLINDHDKQKFKFGCFC